MLSRLLKHPKAASFNITTLVRSSEKAEKLKTFGVHPVVGSHSDLALVEKLAAKSDVVIAIVGIYLIIPIPSSHGCSEITHCKTAIF